MNDTAAILQAVRDGDMPVVERLLSAERPQLTDARVLYRLVQVGHALKTRTVSQQTGDWRYI